jgi:Ca-activated chloride channel family protein
MKFDYPYGALLWVALTCFFVIWSLRGLRRNSLEALEVSRAVFLGIRGTTWQSVILPQVWTALGFLCLALAAGNPYQRLGQRDQLKAAVDVLVLLDISESMTYEDLKPNRLEAAKDTLSRFAAKTVNDRLGLVVFAGEAYMQFPLTFDHALMHKVLPLIRPGQLKGGTAIGVAVAYGVERLKQSRDQAASQILVLLTDGDNTAGNISPEQALGMAKQENIRIYTLAIGKEGQVPVPIELQDFLGRKTKQYQMVTSNINHTLLQRLAHETQGKYYKVEDEGRLDLVLGDIQHLEKSKLPNVVPQENRHYLTIWFLLAGFVCWIIAFGLERVWMRAVP